MYIEGNPIKSQDTKYRYKYKATPMNYMDAKEKCSSLGASLVGKDAADEVRCVRFTCLKVTCQIQIADNYLD